MTTVAFDTLSYSKQLIEAGLDEKIAQAHAKTQVEILKNMLTKQDVDSGRLATTQDLFTLEQRLMRHIDTASSDRQVMRGEMRQGFAAAAADRQAIRDEITQFTIANTADHQAIRDEMRDGFAGMRERFAQMETQRKSMELRLACLLGSMMATGFAVLAVLIKILH